jgi:WD40 repeat protein
MGCGASNRKQGELDKELFKEAYAHEMRDIKGLKIDDENSVKNYKMLGFNPLFKEELNENATESESVKPWLSNIVPPTTDLTENKNEPPYDLKIEHVFGYRIYDTRENLFYIDDHTIIYMTGAMAVIHDTIQHSQVIFGGNNCDDPSLCHTDDIISLSYYPGDISMVATGQRGIKPCILVWSPLDPTVVYAKFEQSKNSKEVTALDFNKTGEYLASIGKDDNHSFYVFDIANNSLLWTDTTDKNVKFSIAYNPLGDEICIVGLSSIYFCYIKRKMKKNVWTIGGGTNRSPVTFTSVKYTSVGRCAVAGSDGTVYLFENSQKTAEFKVSKTVLQAMNYSIDGENEKLYVSDSSKFVHCIDLGRHKVISKFQTKSNVKAMDALEGSHDLLLGLRTGEIIIRNMLNNTETIITKSHFEGIIGGLDYIQPGYILTTGEDNLIILWNMTTKLIEATAFINEKAISNKTSSVDLEEEEVLLTEFPPHQCSKVVTYNPSSKHVAIGINNGTISIRENLKKLDTRYLPQDIKISKDPICAMEFSPNYKYLVAGGGPGELVVLDAFYDYNKLFTLADHSSPVVALDWDTTNEFIQCITEKNDYIFYSMKHKKIIGGNFKNLFRPIICERFRVEYFYL